MVSYMRAEMRATAEANGRRGDIAEAMVDREVVIPGIVERGKLLTLDTDQAIQTRDRRRRIRRPRTRYSKHSR